MISSKNIFKSILSLLFTFSILVIFPFYIHKSIFSNHIALEFLKNINTIYTLGIAVIIFSTIRWFFNKRLGLILSILYDASLISYLYYIFLNSIVFAKFNNVEIIINYRGIVLIFMFLAFSYIVFAYVRYRNDFNDKPEAI